jgi:hypothetical protein
MLQQGVLSANRLAKKQTLSPECTFPIVVVTLVDWPGCKAEERFVSCGLRVKVAPIAGVSRICDIGLLVLLVRVKV